MMEFAAPTSVSHSLTNATATTGNNMDRDTKRRKMVQEQQQQVPDNTMMDATTPVVNKSNTNNGMDIDNNTSSQPLTVSNSSSSASSTTSSNNNNNSAALENSNYAHPSTSNMFNGNALTEEELVYQILQSGAQTYADVVQFCVHHGIPVSRMLQMDLMRRLSYLRKA